MCVVVFFLITGFGDGMEESGFAQKNLVEVILVQEEEEEGEERGGEERVESQSWKVKQEKVFNIHLQVSNTSTSSLPSGSPQNLMRLNDGEKTNRGVRLERRLRIISQSSAASKASLPLVGAARACAGAADCTVLRSGHSLQ